MNTHLHFASLGFACFLALPAQAQGFNIDFGEDTSLPDTYAAAGSSGHWNGLLPGAGASALVDTAGNATSVTITKLPFVVFGGFFDDPSLPAEERELLSDGIIALDDFGGKITLHHLATGDYEILSYGLLLGFPTDLTDHLSPFPSGSMTGGTWSGSFQLGQTHVRTRIFLEPGADLDFSWATVGSGSFAILNGLQLERVWKSVGSGIAGAAGVPELNAQGSLQPGTQLDLRLHAAAPLAPFWVVIGASQADLPLLGGTLIPSPDFFVQAGTTDAAGRGSWVANTPNNLASGLSLFAQAWVFDASVPTLFSATNGVKAVTY